FHCVSETDDSKRITVKICYLSVLENEDVNNAKSSLDIINIIAPEAPKPDNYENYENYKSIYEKEITLADKTTVSALISEVKDDRRIYVKMLKDGMLISFHANKELLTDEFFSSFDVVSAK
ncbi:MAG: hypothetical protein IKT78_00670, partial [Ruminiclostridium sp.]|nr:hypothetical protein [Ruminiclostridium sp.]